MAAIAALAGITASSSSIPSSLANPLLIATMPGRNPKSRVGSAWTTRTGSRGVVGAVGAATVVGAAAAAGAVAAAGFAGAALGAGAAAGDAHAANRLPM